MQFLHPYILWGLLALAIPIIIHLFHFRRFKKVYFTNVKFLKEIKEEKSTRNKLRNLLVLLSRLAAFALLILAFAQPFISRDETTKSGKNNISIFIDNSYSMLAASEDVPLLDKAKRKAEEIVKAYAPTDQFQIMSHELKGSQLRWLSQENAIIAIEDIESSPEVNVLSNVQLKQKQSAPSDGNHIVYLLSDFQESITDLTDLQDTISEVNLLPFQAINESNISVDSAWFQAVVPAVNQNNKLFVKLSNHSNNRKDDVRVSIQMKGQTRPEGTVDIPANSSIIDTINVLVTDPGWQEMTIKVEDHPVQFDDSYYLSFNIKENVKVLSVHDQAPNRYLSALFAGLSQFDLVHTPASNIQYDELKLYDLIILSDLRTISSGLAGELSSYIASGGNTLIFPAKNADKESYNACLNRLNANTMLNWKDDENSVFKINTSEFVFSNVYQSLGRNLKLPSTKGNFTFSELSARGAESLLQYRNGQNYISKYSLDKGKLYICAAPIDKKYNDLTINAEIFVPLLYKVAFSADQGELLAYTIGKDNNSTVKNTTNSSDIIYKVSGEQEFIPGQSAQGNTTLLSFNNMIRKSGFYKVTLNEQMIKGLAFNYDRIESDLTSYNEDRLTEIFDVAGYNILSNTMNADLTNIIKEKDQGVTLWRWCLILALLFLAIETLLLRFWKI